MAALVKIQPKAYHVLKQVLRQKSATFIESDVTSYCRNTIVVVSVKSSARLAHRVIMYASIVPITLTE